MLLHTVSLCPSAEGSEAGTCGAGEGHWLLLWEKGDSDGRLALRQIRSRKDLCIGPLQTDSESWLQNLTGECSWEKFT